MTVQKEFSAYLDKLLIFMCKLRSHTRERKGSDTAINCRDATFFFNGTHIGVLELNKRIEAFKKRGLFKKKRNPYKFLSEEILKYNPSRSKAIKEDGTPTSARCVGWARDYIAQCVNNRELPKLKRLKQFI